MNNPERTIYISLLLIILFLLIVQNINAAEEQAVETTLNGIEGVFLPWGMFYEVNEDLAELDVLRDEVKKLEEENAEWKEKALRFDVGDFFIGVGVGIVVGGAALIIMELARDDG